MNVATVFKQSTTTSARMSTNIHHHQHHHRQRTDSPSALSSLIRFDHNLNRTKNGKHNGLVDEQPQPPPPPSGKSTKATIATASTVAKSSAAGAQFGKSIKSATILMESNTILNVVHRPYQPQPSHNYQRRRHSMSEQDERLLKILKAPPDQPLYINGTTNWSTTINSDDNRSADNLHMQYESATSSIHTVNCENENRPPPPPPPPPSIHKASAAAANNEGD